MTTLSCLYIEYVARVGTCSVDMSIKTKNRGKRFSWLCPKVRKPLFPAKEIVWHKLPVKHQIIVVIICCVGRKESPVCSFIFTALT